jgi:hypothetical protein
MTLEFDRDSTCPELAPWCMDRYELRLQDGAGAKLGQFQREGNHSELVRK